MPATRNQLLARLHCIKKEQGWDDDEYRDILFARTGHRSGADLDGAALARLVAQLGTQKSAPATRRASEWGWVDSARHSRRRLRYIIVLCDQIGIARGKQKRYVEGIAANMDGSIRSFKAGQLVGERPCAVAKPLEFCDEDEIARIVNALVIQGKRCAKRAAGAA